MLRMMMVLVAAIAVSCTENTVAPANPTGTSWQLVSIQQSGSAAITAPASRYTLRFGDDGRVSVRSDCNSCGGSYTLAGSSMAIGPLACTRAFCGDASLDHTYSTALDGTKTIAVSESEMTITGGGVTLRFTR
jgi:heat shock protein HslJ